MEKVKSLGLHPCSKCLGVWRYSRIDIVTGSMEPPFFLFPFLFNFYLIFFFFFKSCLLFPYLFLFFIAGYDDDQHDSLNQNVPAGWDSTEHT